MFIQIFSDIYSRKFIGSTLKPLRERVAFKCETFKTNEKQKAESEKTYRVLAHAEANNHQADE